MPCVCVCELFLGEDKIISNLTAIYCICSRAQRAQRLQTTDSQVTWHVHQPFGQGEITSAKQPGQLQDKLISTADIKLHSTSDCVYMQGSTPEAII